MVQGAADADLRAAQRVAAAHHAATPLVDEPGHDGRAFIGNTLTPIEIGVLAKWNIKPRLMGVPGVANVAIWGERERQLQVQVDPARLSAAGVTLDQVIATAGEALWVSPLSFLESSSPGDGGLDRHAEPEADHPPSAAHLVGRGFGQGHGQRHGRAASGRRDQRRGRPPAAHRRRHASGRPRSAAGHRKVPRSQHPGSDARS